jgi:predicted esterase
MRVRCRWLPLLRGGMGVWLRRLPLWVGGVLACILVAGSAASPLHAQTLTATNLSAMHVAGQTFLTWKPAKGAVSGYVIYRSGRPIRSAFELRLARRVATVQPGGARNQRLESLLKSVQYFRVPGSSVPLGADDELFVLTSTNTASAYYAVTTLGPRGEATQLVPGRNALDQPIYERPGTVVPHFQQRITWGGRAVDLFVHWASNANTATTPAMTNRTSQAFNFAVVKNGRAPIHPLVVRLHGLGGSFLDMTAGSGNPQEYVLALDDHIPGEARNTYWVGWNADLDITAAVMPPPLEGRVVEYTARRVRWTVEWARRTLAIDTARVYLNGVSMGGSGTLHAALTAPWLYAAATAQLPRVTYMSNGTAGPALGSRRFEQVWGRASQRPLMLDGTPVYERTRFSSLLAASDVGKLPFLTIVSGRQDNVVGWPQVLEAYTAVRARAVAARFFWDVRGHEVHAGTYWWPMERQYAVARLRSNQSMVAVTNASSDHEPGNGGVTSGDSTGQTGAFVDWAGPIVDLPDRYGVTLRVRSLTTREGTLSPPTLVYADITPRRLQRFVVRSGLAYLVTVTAHDGIERSEVVRAGELGLTIPRVALRERPTRLEIRMLSTQ